MDQYFVVASDGKEYGPVDLPGLLEWIGQHRVLAATLVRKNDQPPAPAGTLPELAAAFEPAPPSPVSTPAVPPPGYSTALPAEFRSWGFIGQAWDLVKPNWLPLAAMFFLVTAIGCVPYIGGCVFLVIGGAIYVGINRAILRMIAGHPPDVGMMFQGFDRFGQAFLAMLVIGLITAVCCGICLGPAFMASVVFGPRTTAEVLLPALVGGAAAALICVVLAVVWVFVYLVLAETNLGFWQAMEASLDLTAGYRWPMFCLLLACAVVGLIGFLVFFVGIFIAQPVIYTAIALAYRFLQSKRAAAGHDAQVAPGA